MSQTPLPLPLKTVDTEPTLKTARHVLETEAKALLDMATHLDHAFIQAIQLLTEVEGRVIVTGIGKSGHIARKIAATFASTGCPALFIHPAEANHGDMGMITTKDLVLALSNSGETQELSHIIDYTRRFRIPLIAMTRQKGSTLARLSDLALVIPDHAETCPMGLAPTTSTTMMLALGDALAVSKLQITTFSARDFKQLHPGGSLGARLRHVRDFMHTSPNIPLAVSDTVMSSALLTMTQKGFGCIGVCDDANHLIGIITDGDLRRHMNDHLLQKTAIDVMTHNPMTISPDLLLSEALAFLNERQVTAVFVVDNNTPIGLLHIHDILRTGMR